MKRKVKRTNYLDMTPIEVYTLVATRRLKKFPNGYLTKENIKKIVRHIILDVYGYKREDVLKLTQDFFKSAAISGFRKHFDFGNSEILIYSFPEWELKYWEFTKVPWTFWEIKKNQREFVLWVCQKEGLNPSNKSDLRRITAQLLNSYGGSRAWKISGGMYNLLCTVCGKKYKKWEITVMSTWTEREAIAATKWLVEEKLKYTPEQACKLKVVDFSKHNLDGMLQKVYNHSIFAALDAAYPGRYFTEGSRFALRCKG